MSEKKEDLLRRIKKIFVEKGKKKDNYIILILVGVLLLVIVWPVPGSNDDNKDIQTQGSESLILDSQNDILHTESELASLSDTGVKDYCAYLEAKLEQVLSEMDGAGMVKVMVTLKGSEEVIIEKNTPVSRSSISEVDAQGGSRFSNDINHEEETVYYTDANGNENPYIRQILQPEIEGVLVVAQGGDKVFIRDNISEAIKALFGIESHKIKIVKMVTNKAKGSES